MPASVFLLGGGWNDAQFPLTYGRFAAAALQQGPCRIACVLVDHPDRDTIFGWSQTAFSAVGIDDLYPMFVSADRPLRRADVEGATGIFVGGGLTPAYHDAIVPTAADWLPDVVAGGVPYAGYSAGAMIAPSQGIIGGWMLPREGHNLVICSKDVSEDEDHLDIRRGLGLVPFAVDVHASQYGTPTRLLHAIKAGLVSEGWAIDEETMIEVGPNGIVVTGLGVAYEMRKSGDALTVRIHEPLKE